MLLCYGRVSVKELLLPLMIIRVDPVTGEPVRDSAGLCIRALPGHPNYYQDINAIHFKALEGHKLEI